MAYLINTESWIIHDESREHAKKLCGAHYQKVSTISEARIIASKHKKKLKPCKRCGFNQATIEECTK